MAVIMKFLGYFGIALIVILMLLIPQLQYRKDPKGYFLIVEDYDEYIKQKEQEKEVQCA